eukprot:333130-Rhodomonas_salina.1
MAVQIEAGGVHVRPLAEVGGRYQYKNGRILLRVCHRDASTKCGYDATARAVLTGGYGVPGAAGSWGTGGCLERGKRGRERRERREGGRGCASSRPRSARRIGPRILRPRCAIPYALSGTVIRYAARTLLRYRATGPLCRARHRQYTPCPVLLLLHRAP